ncbi:MAG: BamA/TamA family outer membrane protein [Candidatus Krumholzibacteria bacterium]|nr:BamA/TamA family outer membrane protein [Candidatus Krumholzibacteria bacterium]
MVANSSRFSVLVRTLILLVLGAVTASPALAVFGDDNNTEAKTEGAISAINITGNEKTDLNLIYRIMGLKVGDGFTMDAMDDAWDALEDCGYFRFVEIDYDDDDPDQVVLTIELEEDMTTFYSALLRYDRRHKYLVGATLEERNLRGRGETLHVEAAAFYIQQGLVSWQRPWLFGVDGLETTVGVGGEIADFVYRPFRYRKWDSKMDLRWNFNRDFFVGADVTYGYFQQRDDFTADLPERGPDSPTGSAFSGAGSENHWALGATAGFDSRSNPYYPSRGLLAQATVRNWTSNGFADYTESLADLRGFVPLPWKNHILAMRAWGRQVSGPTNLDGALFFGGPETVRGYQYASREGEEGYLLSAEYRIPLFLMQISPDGEMVGFGFHLFGDAGDAWYYGDEAAVAQMSYGAGAHLNLATWQFRFEAARTKEGVWQFEFMDKFNF